MRIFILSIFMVFILAGSATAQTTVTFAWDTHPDAPFITGFNLYQSKVSGGYGTAPVATFAGLTNTTGTIPRPGLGRYYYVLTAVSGDIESDHSNEVSLVVKPAKPKLNSAILSALGSAASKLTELAGIKPKKNLRIED